MTSTTDYRPLPLRADPVWRRYLLARGVSWTGSMLTLVALPLLVFQCTGSPALTAALTALEALPYLLLGLLAGALADRWDRRRLMVVTSLADAVILGSIPAAAVLGILHPVHLLLAATASATAAVFFDAASFAILPALVGRDRIAWATSSSISTYTVIGLAGPALGGTLAAILGPATAIGLDAVTFAAAALLLARLPAARSSLARPDPATRGRLRTDIIAGLRFIWRHPLIRSFTLLGVGNSITGGAVLGLIVVVAVRQVGLPDHDWRIGLFYAAACAGTLAANTALPRLARLVPIGWITLSGLAANWLALLAWATATDLFPACDVEWLRDGIESYFLAMFEPDPDARSRLVLRGNVLLAAYEQWRLQPIVALSLDPIAKNLITFADTDLHSDNNGPRAILRRAGTPWAFRHRSPVHQWAMEHYQTFMTQHVMAWQGPITGEDGALFFGRGLPEPPRYSANLDDPTDPNTLIVKVFSKNRFPLSVVRTRML